jgi:hypothetical protein
LLSDHRLPLTSTIESVSFVQNGGAAIKRDRRHLSVTEINNALSGLLDPVGITVELNSSFELQESWVFPSLLSSIAKMAMNDLGSGHSLRRCASCGLQFLAEAYQHKYCSETCHWREAKRRQRTKNSNRKSRGKLHGKKARK